MNYWILQCNPETYHWKDYIRDHNGKRDTWAISRYVDEVEIGDTAFIWLSNELGKRNRGIYAMAEISGKPDEKRKRFEYEISYWRDGEEKSRLFKLPRLEMQYVKIIDRPLLVDDLKSTGLDLQIMRMAQRSIYKLSVKQGEALKKIVETR